ncbi:hypothetical protein SDC9_178737 [bioreactor metagenome]|uniref:Uncharacterized protein n=1 Tax=bioreactor metagenome TaxID=1076179 RepID=A0A645H5Z2_9ZZZZ
MPGKNPGCVGKGGQGEKNTDLLHQLPADMLSLLKKSQLIKGIKAKQ